MTTVGEIHKSALARQDVRQDEISAPAATMKSAPTASGRTQRIAALDFTKGALVLIMVLYHWLNYFYVSQRDVYRYLRFLTPSFIFITGFLISSVYLAKYGVSNPQLPRRLIQRGLKILGVFVALNVVRALLLPRVARDQLLAEHSSIRSLANIYLIGSNLGAGQEKSVAFYVLVPIGYLLILSAMLLIGARFYKYFFHLVCAASLVSVLVLDAKGMSSANLQLLTIGLLGILLGYVPIEQINDYVRHPYLVMVAYVAYLAAITRWNVIYPLQIVGVCLSLAIIYLAGDADGSPGRVRGVIILLGQYSLLGYIAQIAALQVLHLGIRHTRLGAGSGMVVSFVAAIVLTILAVEAAHRARRNFGAVDRMYRWVFA